MNSEIVKNILFYGSFGSFGLYTFYEVSKSEYDRKLKSKYYFDKMLINYQSLETCNLNHFQNHKNPLLKDISESIHLNNIQYHNSCTTFYNDFKNSYHTYTLHKYDTSHKYGI